MLFVTFLNRLFRNQFNNGSSGYLLRLCTAFLAVIQLQVSGNERHSRLGFATFPFWLSFVWPFNACHIVFLSAFSSAEFFSTHLPHFAKRKRTQALVPLCTHRCWNLEPSEYFSWPTLCKRGQEDFRNSRRWQGRRFSVSKSFGASSTLQRCPVSWQFAARRYCWRSIL